jgi:hypothetical protein
VCGYTCGIDVSILFVRLTFVFLWIYTCGIDMSILFDSYVCVDSGFLEALQPDVALCMNICCFAKAYVQADRSAHLFLFRCEFL